MAWTYFQKLGKGNMCSASKFHRIHGFYEIVHIPTVCIKNNRFTKLFKDEIQNSNQGSGSMVWLLRFQIYKQLLQVHIWLNYHWLDFLFLAILNKTATGFFINSQLLYFYSHTIIDLFLSSIQQTETLNCNLSMLMARIGAWPWLDIKYQILSQWNFDACYRNSMSRR